jgi:CheY-like chemotaxis protein
MPRILIVDDEASIVTMLRTLFESASFEVQSASSAAEAKSRLKNSQFDIVMTDMRMETSGAGYEVVRAAAELQPRPAIAILTAFPIPSAEFRAYGADLLFVKGSDLLSLPDKLQAVLKQRPQNESPIKPDRRTATR